ncbi:MAG: hypothetical protein JEZ06_20110 [Anaerolineaceae bacterium]|nr:hypothetical protein [Anaerolineaceae bacterium]
MIKQQSRAFFLRFEAETRFLSFEMISLANTELDQKNLNKTWFLNITSSVELFFTRGTELKFPAGIEE